jgi:hypothetical protein
MLFGKNDIDKSIKALSGGEKGRMLFGKLMSALVQSQTMWKTPKPLLNPSHFLPLNVLEPILRCFDNKNACTLSYIIVERIYIITCFVLSCSLVYWSCHEHS